MAFERRETWDSGRSPDAGDVTGGQGGLDVKEGGRRPGGAEPTRRTGADRAGRGRRGGGGRPGGGGGRTGGGPDGAGDWLRGGRRAGEPQSWWQVQVRR